MSIIAVVLAALLLRLVGCYFLPLAAAPQGSGPQNITDDDQPPTHNDVQDDEDQTVQEKSSYSTEDQKGLKENIEKVQKKKGEGKSDMILKEPEASGNGGSTEHARVHHNIEPPRAFTVQAQTRPVTSTHGILAHAHGFVMYNPVLNSITENREKVLLWLAKFTIRGVEFDSAERVPPPQCHPGTRLLILNELRTWVDNVIRTHRLLWLKGSAGVGKSAIIQTLAEALSFASKLGATIFFSRPNQRNDPSLIFPTIAYQLAVQIQSYREYLTRKMADDPRLLEKDMANQFRVLIAEPFSAMSADKSVVWAILLDGLDECNGEAMQTMIINFINQFIQEYPVAPLVWIIASRPEVHLTHAFDKVRDGLRIQDVPVNSDDACRDVERFLRASFVEIREKYRDLLPANIPWPGETVESEIARSALGHFGVASTITYFIEDPHVCDPISQLEIVMSALTPGADSDPLFILHNLYTRIMDAVPRHLLEILKLLLDRVLERAPAVLVTDASDEHNPKKLDTNSLVMDATLLGLRQHTVYAALRKLHSVIKVPSPENSMAHTIQFYHASFADYLSDPTKSGEYALLDRAFVARKRWMHILEITHQACLSSNDFLIPRSQFKLSWTPNTMCQDFDDWVSQFTMNSFMSFLMQYLLPESALGWAPRFSITNTELLSAFEKIDFGRLIPNIDSENGKDSLFGLIRLAKCYSIATPACLLESNLIKRVSIQDLSLAELSAKRRAVKGEWQYDYSSSYCPTCLEETGVADTSNPDCPYTSRTHITPPTRDCLEDLAVPYAHPIIPTGKGYITYEVSPADDCPHCHCRNRIMPMSDLVPQLELLCQESPELEVWLFGKGSWSCAMIAIDPDGSDSDGGGPDGGNPGTFYYLPYCQ